MKLWVLGSGSRGNAVLLESGGSRILIDAGFPCNVIAERLEGIEIEPESIEAVVVTHEHHDHVRGAGSGSRKWGWDIYATAGTRVASKSLRSAKITVIGQSACFSIGDFDLTTAPVSHDAVEPVAVVAVSRSTGASAGIVYDLGCVSYGLRECIRGVDMLVMESNHDEIMLQRGPYPMSLRARIGGPNGHLSNKVAAATVSSIAAGGLRHVILAHLSEWCNAPTLALETMRYQLGKTAFKGKITAAPQDSAIGPFIPSSISRASSQLSLSL